MVIPDKTRYSRMILYISLAIDLLSSASLAQVLLDFNYEHISKLSTLFGVIASVLGIYLATSDITKKMSTVTSAALTWGRASNEYKDLWLRFELGEDVWELHRDLTKQLELVNTDVTNNLDTNDKLYDLADKE